MLLFLSTSRTVTVVILMVCCIVAANNNLNGFTLPNGYSWDPTFVDNEKDGSVEVYDQDGLITAVLEYKNDMLNGLCKFYNDGSIESKIMYVNDMANGWGYEYTEDRKELNVFYKNGKKEIVLRKNNKKEGYYDELDMKSGDIISTCFYDNEFRKAGKGFLYRNNIIDKIMMYENGNEKCLKEFHGSEMIEYDNHGKMVYEGDYLDSFEKEYLREGYGKEYYNDKIVYKGEWRDGKKEGVGKSYINGRTIYDGEWRDDLPEGKGTLYEDDRIVVTSDEWKDGRLSNDNEHIVYVQEEKKFFTVPKLKVTVRDMRDWNSLFEIVSELILAEGFSYYYRSNFDIDYYPFLRSIVIEKDSLGVTGSMTIKNCEMLEVIEIKNGDFNNRALSRVTKIEISHLPRLTKITIGNNAAYYATSLHLTDLPLLEEISLGDFALKHLSSLVLSNLPRLTKINIGDHAADYATSFDLTDLPLLAELSIGDFALKHVSSLVLSNLPQLETFTTVGAAFFHTKTLSLTNLPQLTTMSIGMESFFWTHSLSLSNLPRLSKISLEYSSFRWTTSLTLNNVPFRNGQFKKSSFLFNGTFAFLYSSFIISDSSNSI